MFTLFGVEAKKLIIGLVQGGRNFFLSVPHTEKSKDMWAIFTTLIQYTRQNLSFKQLNMVILKNCYCKME